MNNKEPRIIPNACGTLMNLLLDNVTQIKIGQNKKFLSTLISLLKIDKDTTEESCNISFFLFLFFFIYLF